MGAGWHSLAVTSLSAMVLFGCGGGNHSDEPPPPAPDFSLSLSAVSASAVLGTATSALTVSTVPRNGLSSAINIMLQGLPPGVDATPGPVFSVQPGASQSFVMLVSSSAAVGEFPITLVASSGSVSHTAKFVLTTEPLVSVRAYQIGSVLYLESSAGTDVARVGLETQWGGSIVEVSLNGTNYVNSADTGREVQPAQYGEGPYDDCCTGSFGWGWNPVQAGDKYSHGSPVLSQVVASDSLYVKTQGYQWNPDDKGGGPDQPVLGDTYVEARVSAVTRHANTFQVHYKVTHFGADQHANSFQEFPVVYVNLGYDRLAVYAGTAPWTNASVSIAPAATQTPPPVAT